NGLIPKSVCFTANVAQARSVSDPIATRTSTGTSRVCPTSVTSATRRNPLSAGATVFEVNEMVGYCSTLRVSVRIASVPLRTSAAPLTPRPDRAINKRRAPPPHRRLEAGPAPAPGRGGVPVLRAGDSYAAVARPLGTRDVLRG